MTKVQAPAASALQHLLFPVRKDNSIVRKQKIPPEMANGRQNEMVKAGPRSCCLQKERTRIGLRKTRVANEKQGRECTRLGGNGFQRERKETKRGIRQVREGKATPTPAQKDQGIGCLGRRFAPPLASTCHRADYLSLILC